jgi:hypothetical protein
MKSQELEGDFKSKTGCKKCVFCQTEATTEGELELQTGCFANRLDVFKKRNEAKQFNGFYEIDRVCNYYRTKKENSSPEKELRLVKDQVVPSFGIVVCLNETDQDESIEKTIDSITKIDTDKFKVSVILKSPLVQTTISKLVNISNQLKINNKIKNRLVFNMSNAPESVKDYDTYKYISNKNFFIQINQGQKVPDNFLEEVNDLINEKLERVLMYEKSGVIATSSSLVKKRYLDFGDYELMIKELKKELELSEFYKT